MDLETWVNVFQKKVGGFGGFYGVLYGWGGFLFFRRFSNFFGEVLFVTDKK